MTILHYVNEHQSDIRAIKPGWYGMESNGKLSSGPFPNQGKCLTGITQPRNNFRGLTKTRVVSTSQNAEASLAGTPIEGDAP
jgi:hypothetical protein